MNDSIWFLPYIISHSSLQTQHTVPFPPVTQTENQYAGTKGWRAVSEGIIQSGISLRSQKIPNTKQLHSLRLQDYMQCCPLLLLSSSKASSMLVHYIFYYIWCTWKEWLTDWNVFLLHISSPTLYHCLSPRPFLTQTPALNPSCTP